MSTISRAAFVGQTAGKTVNLSPMTAAERAAVSTRGIPVVDGRANLPDATTAGKLFDYLDTLDRNGSASSLGGDRVTGVLSRGFALASALLNQLAVDPVVARWNSAAQVGHDYVVQRQKAHWDGCTNDGMGYYYGDHSAFAQAQVAVSERIRAGTLRGNEQTEICKAANAALVDSPWMVTQMSVNTARVVRRDNPNVGRDLRESSCVGWMLEVATEVLRNFDPSRATEVRQAVIDAGSTGHTLCKALQQDGWTAVRFASAGSTEAVRVGDTYAGIRVDAVINGFSSPAAAALLERVAQAPMFLGIFNKGGHCFAGVDGCVSENHWAEQPDSPNVLEQRPLATRGGDGILMLPPGCWAASTPVV